MKTLRASAMLTLVFIVLTGLAFPLVIWAIGQAAFPHQANGSLVKDASGKTIGSELLGQNFAKPEYFHPRPSAAGNGYDAANSSGTNLGPTSDKLINGIHKKTSDGKDDPGNFDGVKDLAAAYRAENGLDDKTSLPSDAVTRSASGLDPDISVPNALLQAPRVAKARHLSLGQVEGLVRKYTQERTIGVFGEPRINVLQINRALGETDR